MVLWAPNSNKIIDPRIYKKSPTHIDMPFGKMPGSNDQYKSLKLQLEQRSEQGSGQRTRK